jgi:hypothetical protein
MIDENFVAPKKETADYTPLPDDMYQVELLDVTSERRPTYDTRLSPDDQKEYETVLNFQFTVLDEGEVEGKQLRGRNIWQNFVPSYLYISSKHGKNALYQIVEALTGQAVTPEQEAYGITGKILNALIGSQCRVVTRKKTKGDKTFNNIDSFMPVKAPLGSLTAEEKEAAKVKPKEGEAAKAAEAAYAGGAQA